MSFDFGLGFEIETMHIVAVVGVIILAVLAFFYFRSKGKNVDNDNHVQFNDSLNEDFPREKKQQCQGDSEKCMMN
jgi:hypothetical protein